MIDLRARLSEVQLRAARGMDFGLDRIQRALAKLGDPQDAVPSVHVAGTNGKGSTSAMVASIARAAGLSTGLYTSPHLCRVAERIRLGGEPIDDAAFDAALAEVLERCAADLTFFETLTAAAFVAFRNARVDLAVVEVGLGGRLDATNTMKAPVVTAITSIDFDHTELLGDTLAAIAREKAGIVRRGVPLVVGPVQREARDAIEACVREASAGPLFWVPADGPRPREIGLAGAHQRDNAAVASLVADVLTERFPRMHQAVAAGLRDVTWEGRFERVDPGDGGPSIVFDCAHNPAGARVLARTLESEGYAPERTVLLFGALADKAFAPMLRELSERARRRVYTAPKGRTPAPFDALVAVASGDVESEPIAALARARAMAPPGGAVVVTGSSYLVGELRAAVFGIDPDPIIAL